MEPKASRLVPRPNEWELQRDASLFVIPKGDLLVCSPTLSHAGGVLGGATRMIFAIFCALSAGLAGAQRGRAVAGEFNPFVSETPRTADEVIEQMASAAGVIFAGQVIAVRRPAGYAGSAERAAEGIVEIDFRVDEAVRGPAKGSVYTLREWSGLWAGNAERYRVGQRLLMFLRTPNSSRLSSTVHGAEGAVPLRGGGIAPGPDDASVAAGQWMADVRWLEAQTLHRTLWLREPGRPPVRVVRTGEDHGLPSLVETAHTPDLVVVPRGPWITQMSAADFGMEPLSKVIALCLPGERSRDAPR